jgi:hypothetical protein
MTPSRFDKLEKPDLSEESSIFSHGKIDRRLKENLPRQQEVAGLPMAVKAV